MTPINSAHLIWWLRQRYDEDEREATSWRDNYSPSYPVPRDADQLIADVAAKRRIVDRCERYLALGSQSIPSDPIIAIEVGTGRALALTVLRELATAHEGAEGFDEGWRVR